MQPYFLPYLGYWQLIREADIFVIYDNIQYTKKGWFNRNYILCCNKKLCITVPIKKDSDYLDVNQRYLSDDYKRHISKIINQISSNYRRAPYFESVMPFLTEILSNQEVNLFNYNYHIINAIVDYLEINTKLLVSSSIFIDHNQKGQDRVISMLKELGASMYINPIGGLDLYNKEAFIEEGIKLRFLESKLPPYRQFEDEFVPSLSIIDILMFNDKEKISNMLAEYSILSQ